MMRLTNTDLTKVAISKSEYQKVTNAKGHITHFRANLSLDLGYTIRSLSHTFS
jgi:hypothetical protein